MIWPAKKFWPFQHNFVRNAVTTQDGLWCWVYLYRVHKRHIFPLGSKIEKYGKLRSNLVVHECLNFVGYLRPCCLLLYL